MRRFFIIRLALFMFFINTCVYAADKIVTKNIKAVASDGFIIKATLSYPKVSGKKDYSTVILLHSLGYNSGWWNDLPQKLIEQGYAVLAIDLRGHGQSIYNSKLIKTSWKSFKNNAYKKYPDDVMSVVNQVNSEYLKLRFFNNWALVGSDIGASTGVLFADKYKTKPQTIIMIAPVVNSKGLYIPISMAQLDKVDFLIIKGNEDHASTQSADYLKRFAQSGFLEYTSESKTTGMVLLKNDEGMTSFITKYLVEYLH